MFSVFQSTKCGVNYHEVTDISNSPGLRNGAQYGNGFRSFVSLIVPPPSRWGFRTNWSGAAKAIATVLSPSGPLRQQRKKIEQEKKMLQYNHFTLTFYVLGLNDISLSYLYLDMNIQDIHIEKATI